MSTADILDHPCMRHYLPSSKPQVRISFYKLSANNEITMVNRTVEMASNVPTRSNPRTALTHLLSKPIEELIREVEAEGQARAEREQQAKAKAESQSQSISRFQSSEPMLLGVNETAKDHRAANKIDDENDLAGLGLGEEEMKMGMGPGERSGLWVDKYAPRRFSELLTDERVNREILMWLKSWDKIVFPEKVRLQKRTETPMPSRGTSTFRVLL